MPRLLLQDSGNDIGAEAVRNDGNLIGRIQLSGCPDVGQDPLDRLLSETLERKQEPGNRHFAKTKAVPGLFESVGFPAGSE
jgi:hypothetical protein